MQILIQTIMLGAGIFLMLCVVMDFSLAASLVGAACSATGYLIGQILIAKRSATQS